MQDISKDSTKVLIEKLAFARELAVIRPELESLRTQVASQKELLAEKLSLQRQLTTIQVELENAQRTAQRAISKAGKSTNDESEFEAQLDDLQKQVKEERLARKEAVREVEQLKKDIVSEKKASARAVKNTHNESDFRAQLDELETELKDERSARKEANQKIEQLKKDMAADKKTVAKQAKGGEASDSLKEQLDGLRKELAAEKKERQKIEKMLQKEQTVWEAQKSLLEDKLDQFRTKLRSTKDKLKANEEELQQARSTAPSQAVTKARPEKPVKNPRKRVAAAMMDPEAIGTPGDGPPAKRGRRSTSIALAVPGDKSTFSITPFLNRTMSLAPDTPMSNTEEPQKSTEADEAALPAASPSDAVTKKAQNKRGPKAKPLSPASSSKHNAKPIGRKKTFSGTLEKVAEEASEVENKSPSAPIPKPTAVSQPLPPAPRPKTTALKPRKSIVAFASFAEEPEPEKRKKRKLGGGSGLPKTLFDEEDDKPPSKPIPGRGLFGARGFSKVFGAKAGPASLVDTGFQFSPLKKDRRAASAVGAN
jgi:hypothetical protein